MTNDEIIEAIRQGGDELKQRIWDEFFSVSLISDTEPDTSPISVADVDNFFASINAAKYPEINKHPFFEVPSEEELSLLQEAAIENHKENVRRIFEAEGKMIEERRNDQ